MSTFVLLLGFAVLKMAVGAVIVWLGMRSQERPDDDGGVGPFDGVDPHDGPPPWRERRRRPRRPEGRVHAPARGRPHGRPIAGRRPAPV